MECCLKVGKSTHHQPGAQGSKGVPGADAGGLAARQRPTLQRFAIARRRLRVRVSAIGGGRRQRRATLAALGPPPAAARVARLHQAHGMSLEHACICSQHQGVKLTEQH